MARSRCDEIFEEFIVSLIGRTKELQIALAATASHESGMLMGKPETPRLPKPLASPEFPSSLRLLEAPTTPRSPKALSMMPVPNPIPHMPDVTCDDDPSVLHLVQESFTAYMFDGFSGGAKFNRIVAHWERFTQETNNKRATGDLAKMRSIWLFCSHGEQSEVIYRPTNTLRAARKAPRMGDIWQYERIFLKHLVRHSDTMFTAAYMCMIISVAAYDLVSFPFVLIVETDKTLYWDTLMTLAWISSSIWSLDLLMSCFQGFYTAEGVVELRLGHTCLQYLRSWFVFDIIVNVNDWITCVQMHDDSSGVLQFARVLRVLRFFRVIRLLRSTDKINSMMAETLSSEFLLVVVRFMFLLLVVLFISHYIACAWLALAVNTVNGLKEPSWILTHHLEHSDPLLQYVASLHWCLTQFTPATTNIAPTNGQERVFAIVVVIFGLVMFSTVVSSLTSAVVELTRMRSSRSSEETQIRRYMKNRRVPLHLCKQIWAYYQKHYKVRKRITNESTISFFQHMPAIMRRELHFTAHFPVISQHPVFEALCSADDEVVLLICSNVVSERWIDTGREIFSAGDVGAYMYFLESGELSYACHVWDEKRITVPHFIAEASLWTKWRHRGTLVAETPCDLFLLSATELDTMFTANRCWFSNDSVRGLRKYAALFARRISVCSDGRVESVELMTDLMLQFEILHAFAAKAFPRFANGSSGSITSSQPKSVAVASSSNNRSSTASILSQYLPFMTSA